MDRVIDMSAEINQNYLYFSQDDEKSIHGKIINKN
jgi:hypothetical protein